MKIAKLIIPAALLLGACASREIFHVRGCDERLRSGYKREECRECVARPLPHAYLADRPDGSRCYRR